MLGSTLFSLVVLATHAYAGVLAADGLLSGSSDALERRVADAAVAHLNNNNINNNEEADQVLNSLAKRVVIGNWSAAAGVQRNADGSINMTAWDNTANAACTQALSKLTQSTNPSGTCICYNLPALNNNTGAFEADLRLYQISAAREDFAGIAGKDVQVSLIYNGASASPVTSQTAAKAVAARQSVSTESAGPKMLQSYLFVGQINQEEMAKGPGMASLQALVMPTVRLSATNANGATVSTNVSSSEAAFVAGIFSDAVVMSNTAVAQAALQVQLDGLANGTVAFVVPGVQLILFPIGLVMYSVWMVIGIAAYAFGTYERMNYRQQFQQRSARSGSTPNTI